MMNTQNTSFMEKEKYGSKKKQTKKPSKKKVKK